MNQPVIRRRMCVVLIYGAAIQSIGAAKAVETVRHLHPSPGIQHVKTLSQNWSHDEAEWFYDVPQGSRLLPYSWLVRLEQAGSAESFLAPDHVRELGLMPRIADSGSNPGGLPVGFAKDANVDSVGLTCAACHTTEVHFQGTAYIVDGAPTLMDVERLLKDLEASLNATLAEPEKFDRFATAVLTNPTPQRKEVLRTKLQQVLAERKGYNTRNLTSAPLAPFGPGRVDAFGAILNEVTVRFIDDSDNHRPAGAPVSYPFLWDTPQHDLLQWNGAAENFRNVFLKPIIGTSDVGALGRNTGEVLGVFGLVDLGQQFGLLNGYASSIDQDNLIEIEESLRALWSPQWPDGFPDLVDDKVDLGRALFEQHCLRCHADIDREDEERSVVAEMHAVGTDQAMARDFATRVSNTGPLEGRTRSIPGLSRFGDRAAAIEILAHVVQRVLVGPSGGEVDANMESASEPGMEVESNEGERVQTLANAVGDFKFRVNAEVTVNGSSLTGSFESVEIQDDKVIGLSGGKRVSVERNGTKGAIEVSPDRGVSVADDAAAPTWQQLDEELEVSASADGISLAQVDDSQIQYQYKGRPLNGIWATAPYLHNGSVPTLRELLKKPQDRVATFRVGDREFIPEEVGFRYDQGPFEFDTALPGNANSGHAYGSGITDEDRENLLEYLKSL